MIRKFLIAIIFTVLTGNTVLSEQSNSSDTQLVFLHELFPNIYQDIRYATEKNFTNAVLPGYHGMQCRIMRDTAEALNRVEAELNKMGYALIVYDCLRPIEAVTAMVNWVKSGDPLALDPLYYPNIPKKSLIEAGYISATSAHTSGKTVDVAIKEIETDIKNPLLHPSKSIKMDTKKLLGNEIDMGTNFDCFDKKSHTFSTEISRTAAKNRQILLTAMQRHGFKNYFREWWHYTFIGTVKQQIR